MRDRQFVTPVLVRAGKAEKLTRVPFDERTIKERWLQDLLYEHPSLIPVGEIEPVFEGLRPLASEVPTGSGSLDLLFMNGEGYLTLVETKLWRNPEARRVVVAQIIDYAKRMSSWTFEDLHRAILASRSRAPGDNPLIDLAREEDEDFEEQAFIDRMNRNLRLGRFVLLIIGDGIQEGVENMVEFLNQTPQLQFRMGLVEMALYRVGDSTGQEFFVQPRLLTRTREVVRAVVEIKTTVEPTGITISLPPAEASAKRERITEEAFFAELGKHAPEVVEFARWVLDEAPKHDLEIEWGDAGPLLRYVYPESGDYFTLGQLHRNGRLGSIDRFGSRLRKLGLPKEIYQRYLERLASFIRASGGAEWEQIVTRANPKKSAPLLVHLAPHREAWFKLIDETVSLIQEAMADREEA